MTAMVLEKVHHELIHTEKLLAEAKIRSDAFRALNILGQHRDPPA